MTKLGVVLKPGKEKALLQRHHWIFSGAIASYPEFENGDILPVYSAKGEMLGSAYFNKNSSLSGRMVAFDGSDPLEAIHARIEAAAALRRAIFHDERTTAYRLINGEGDFLPGLVVDKYGDILVVQITTLGMDRLRVFITDALKRILSPSAIFEKSNVRSRKEEGLGPVEGLLYGSFPDTFVVKENDYQFLVNIPKGQKTGFFLDQREMRHLVGNLARGRRVLNCFSYTGGFSVYAAGGGAASVVSLDISEEAVALAEENMKLNGFDRGIYRTGDVFQFLRDEPLPYNFVILDPPAFAKKKHDVVKACRGYKDINRLAMRGMPPGSYLLTCSCSYHIEESLFQTVVFQAAVEAGRRVRVIAKHRMAPDHPVNICHREGDYLKSLLLYIE